MRILALDATHETFSVALIEDHVLMAEMTLRLPKQVSTELVPVIHMLLNKLEWSLESLTLIAAAAGPGSYTGIRLAVTTAKALAYGARLPLVGISSLKLLAQALPPLPYPVYLVPLIDARGERTYGGVYYWRQEGDNWRLKTVVADQVQSVEAWVDTLQALPPLPGLAPESVDFRSTYILIGDPRVPYRDAWQERLGTSAYLIEGVYASPRAAHLMHLAVEAWEDGAFADPFFVPFYIQKSAPEKKLEQK
ncbi:MAG: tRNA (adenosine(37)-N6)-threonylcarbamoyltransferase complex dimerization subunit type 1 TsaB [Candidatus Carbobacillus altaicus]|nr:tRNA (adenosine(37)-N6)-threonylcarbamoyltransferase complex dimerization subunit type 1 TsaB [Candidatus Carbobacillus altaicus]